jgi:S-adenosylmethionine-diacylgycerolhomoserine-N-methlytransferase
MERYYSLHSRFYDATRWTFLFGRGEILRRVPAGFAPRNILEIGCGTGKNIRAMSRLWPGARLTGLDASETMLRAAREKTPGNAAVHWLHRLYDAPLSAGGILPKFDLILFSYCLSMANPGWEKAVSAAAEDLAGGGILLAADFHRSNLGLFKKWMALNHVRMDAHLLPALSEAVKPLTSEKRRAYGFVWEYFLFSGKKRVPKFQGAQPNQSQN